MDARDVSALAAVTELAAGVAIDPADLVAAVDDAMQSVRSALSLPRQQAAEAASYRTTTRTRVTPHGSYPLPFTAEEIEAAARRERELLDRARSAQLAADAFRMKAVAATARRASAAAMRDVQLTVLADGNLEQAEHDEAQTMLAAAKASLASADAELAGLLPEAAALRRSFIRAAADSDTREPENVPGLLELHADPLGSDIRILLGIEPADTVTLLAVLDSPAAASEHRALAIKLSGELLAELRANGWPQPELGPDRASTGESDELTFADAGAFLGQFFPGSESEIRQQSARLAAASTLALLRRGQKLSLADLAGSTGLAARELWRLENDELAAAHVADVAAYVRALGGRLELAVTFPDGNAAPLT